MWSDEPHKIQVSVNCRFLFFSHPKTQVLTVAVLSILVTAPIGAAAIALSAPRLLRRSARFLDPVKGRAVTEPDEADVDMSVL